MRQLPAMALSHNNDRFSLYYKTPFVRIYLTKGVHFIYLLVSFLIVLWIVSFSPDYLSITSSAVHSAPTYIAIATAKMIPSTNMVLPPLYPYAPRLYF